MRAGLYARVSREEQAEGYSIDEQLSAMQRFCEDRGWSVAAEYVEPGHSGTVKDRPAFSEALDDCEAGKLDILLTHQLDRFYRNLQLQLETLGQLGRWGVGYLSITEQIDYSTPQGMLFLQMLGAFNEYYVANLRREVRKGKRGRAKQGLSNAGTPSHGYTLVDGQHVIDPEAAAAVRFAFEHYATGEHSDQDIANLLNRAAYPPCGYRADRWVAPTVRHMLINRAYLGEVQYHGRWWSGQHEAIIDRELFDQCQAARAKRRAGRGAGGRKTGRVYLLQRLVRCHLCGLPMHMTGTEQQPYYIDAARKRGVDCPVGGRCVPTGTIDDQVGELVKRLRLPEDWRERLAELVENREEQESTEGKRRYLQGKLRRLREVYIDGDLGRGEYDPRRAQLQAQIDALQEPEAPEVEEAGATLESLADAWEDAPLRLRAEMLRTIFESVVIDVAARRLVCVKPWPPFVALFRMDGMEEKKDGCFYVEKEDQEARSED